MVLQGREENDRMKAVTVRGMEMPKQCGGCPLRSSCKQRIYIEERPKDCPLIETIIEDEVVIPLGTLSKILDGDRTTYDFSEYICEVNGLACSGCSLFCEHRRRRR